MTAAFLMHALSPLHVGVGQAADIIDLPIARQRATNIPYVPGSAIKGVFREAHRSDPAVGDDQWNAIFGPDTNNAADHAGALMVGDAVLLAMPVRSFKGTFAWVTSPLLLAFARRDLPGLPAVASPNGTAAKVSHAAVCHGGKLFLEDLDLGAAVDPAVLALANWLEKLLWAPGAGYLAQRLAVVDDETMTFLLETATQLDTRVRLREETRTVAKGALWIEESLPAETILVGLMSAERSRGAWDGTPQNVIDAALPAAGFVGQFGGKATVGRGRCRIVRA